MRSRLAVDCVGLQLALVREQIVREWALRLVLVKREFWCIDCRHPFELLSFPSGESYPGMDILVCKCPLGSRRAG